jgi:hypothetical protein
MFPPSELRDLVERVAAVAGVVAVTLGGSRAAGTEHAASDWDFCVFYRGMIDIEAIRAFGYTGDFYEPGSWGRLLNGGAWLSIGDTRADLLYRDLDFVEHCIAEAEAGRFEIDEARGFVAGLPSYFLVGEVALGRPLIGSLPRAVYPEALRTRAATRWQAIASFSLWEAEQCARRGEPATCAGLLAKAAIAASQARLAERGEWVFSEKAILARAEFADAAGILARGVGASTTELATATEEMRRILGLADDS